MYKNVLTTKTVLFNLLFILVIKLYRPLYDLVKEFPDVYFSIQFIMAVLIRRVTYRRVRFVKPKNTLLVLLISLSAIYGCSSVQQSLDPNVFYKRDIQLEINGEKFDGYGVPKRANSYEIKIRAQGVIDMLTITSCHREESIETPHKFWESGKSYVYNYTPIHGIEDGSGCLLDIGAYEKIKGRHSWGTIDFQTERETLSAQTLCGGQYTAYSGVSACQSKYGLIQKINFDERVKVSPDGARCNVMMTSNEKEYTYTMPKGECTYYFVTKAGKIHRHTTLGYEGILIREVSN